jgi:hypothetical protein
MTALTLQPPLFDAHAPLATVLTWEGLPNVLRRALTRSISRDTLERVIFIDSLGSMDPRFREWLVGLLALDIGVDLEGEQRDNLIGVFSRAALGTAAMTRFCVHGVGPQQGYGASFRSPRPSAPATVCVAAYVYFTNTGLVDSEFVFIAGATAPVDRLDLPLLRNEQLDEPHIERALASISARLGGFGDIDETTAVVRDALLECQQTLVARDRGQQ